MDMKVLIREIDLSPGIDHYSATSAVKSPNREQAGDIVHFVLRRTVCARAVTVKCNAAVG